MATQVRQKLEIAFLVCINCVILCLFSLPVIVYYTSQDQLVFSPLNCSNHTPVEITRSELCIPEPYTAGYCVQTLRTTQACVLGPSNTVSVNTSSLQQHSLDENITILINTIERNGSQQCRDAVLPFMCLYTFPLCDNITGHLYQPTRDECVRVSEQVCSHEWNLTTQLGYQHLLPDCEMLNGLQNVSKCNVDFIRVNGTCQPRCDRFESQSHITIILTRVLRFISAITTVVSSVAFLIVSVIRYKIMYSFPLILLVYMTIELLILGVVLLITESGSSALLCSSVTVQQAIDNPAPLCTISGAVFNYVIVGVHIFWFFHVCFFFYKIMFPFHSRAHQSRHRYLHLTMVVVGFLSPVPAVVVALTVDKYKYIVGQFPPAICYSMNNDHFFFSNTLPLLVILAFSTVLLTIIFWKIHKHNLLLKTESEGAQTISTVEKKLLAVLTVYILSGLVIVVAVTFYHIRTPMNIHTLSRFLECVAIGHGKCNRNLPFGELDLYLWLSSLVFLFFGLLPLLNLLFVIDFKEFHMRLRRISLRHSRKSSASNLHYKGSQNFELQQSSTDLL